MKPILIVPIFALAPDSTWADLENAMEGCVQSTLSESGRILPLMLFAPMTEPENPDTWEPIKGLPENLLMVSIERHIDERVFRALMRAKFICGETQQTASFPSVRINFEGLVAEAYEQMKNAGIRSFAHTNSHKDDPSFFFLRGAAAVKAFAAELPKATR